MDIQRILWKNYGLRTDFDDHPLGPPLKGEEKKKAVAHHDEAALMGWEEKEEPQKDTHEDKKLPGNFPDVLLLGNYKYPTPGIPFSQKVIHLGKPLTQQRIHVSPSQSFEVKFRNIFKETTVSFMSATQSSKWVEKPNYEYWPQQLNFAVWCATSGCGVATVKRFPPMVQDFLAFHVYFTTRRVLYELGVPLPGDLVFNQTNKREPEKVPDTHGNNLTAITIATAGVGWWLFGK